MTPYEILTAKAVAKAFAEKAGIDCDLISHFSRGVIIDGAPAYETNGLKAAIDDGAAFWGTSIYRGMKNNTFTRGTASKMLETGKGLNVTADLELIVFCFDPENENKLYSGLSAIKKNIWYVDDAGNQTGFSVRWSDVLQDPASICRAYFPQQMATMEARQLGLRALAVRYSAEFTSLCHFC